MVEVIVIIVTIQIANGYWPFYKCQTKEMLYRILPSYFSLNP